MKKITISRSPKVQFDYLTQSEIKEKFKLFKKNNSLRQKKTVSLFNEFVFLTLEQSIDLLWWVYPFLTEDFIFIKIINDCFLKDQILIHHKKSKFNQFKIIHNYLNTNNIIKAIKRFNVSTLYIDQKCSFLIIDKFWDKNYLKPDSIVVHKDKYYFIETDTWTETNTILREKWNMYIQYFIQEHNLWNIEYNQVKVLFFFNSQRKITTVKKNKVFNWLELLDLIEYWIN